MAEAGHNPGLHAISHVLKSCSILILALSPKLRCGILERVHARFAHLSTVQGCPALQAEIGFHFGLRRMVGWMLHAVGTNLEGTV